MRKRQLHQSDGSLEETWAFYHYNRIDKTDQVALKAASSSE